ncbi:Mpv17-like protein 2 [Pseudolycoriella hygida]|uniref:Mpv17-like protein 2 n=1 Tax=Pseudolycoriella hygida TaxID=35572 RepID=A0A9Q0MY48_9DIPT|nr:Mpv17-like protein 2 [Pseudolycoriella hygida]
MLKRLITFTNDYKIVRGMISYSILWPVGNLMQQTFVENKNFRTYDWKKCLRFSVYGACIMGPTMFFWVRLAAKLWPGQTFRSSISKAITEQFTYDPASICTFLYLMTLFEGKSMRAAKHELKAKFFDTYKVGAIYWPIVQTINFKFVPVRNQVVCTSFFSMLWSAFLAYMKHIEIEEHKLHENDEK